MIQAPAFYVYTHTRNDTGAVFYVGKGHGRRAWNRSLRNNYWKRIAAKYGVTVNIVKDGLSELCAFTIEKILINTLRKIGVALTNLTDGGEGMSGFLPNAETKAKQRAAKLGTPLSEDHRRKISLSNTGKKMSDAHREKLRNRIFSKEHRLALSRATTGRKHSPETIAKISAVKSLYRATEETRAKQSASLSGLKNPHSSPVVHTFFHEVHGIRSCTQYELRSEFNLTHANLSKVVSGQRNHVKGWRIKEVE